MTQTYATAYRTEEGQPWVLPVVRTIEAQMASDPMLDHEYLPICGLKAFRDAATRLLLGADSPAIAKNRVSLFLTVCTDGSLLPPVIRPLRRCVLCRQCREQGRFALGSTSSSASTPLEQYTSRRLHGVARQQ